MNVCVSSGVSKRVCWVVGRVEDNGTERRRGICEHESECVRTSYHRLVLGARSRAVKGTCRSKKGLS